MTSYRFSLENLFCFTKIESTDQATDFHAIVYRWLCISHGQHCWRVYKGYVAVRWWWPFHCDVSCVVCDERQQSKDNSRIPKGNFSKASESLRDTAYLYNKFWESERFIFKLRIYFEIQAQRRQQDWRILAARKLFISYPRSIWQNGEWWSNRCRRCTTRSIWRKGRWWSKNADNIV